MDEVGRRVRAGTTVLARFASWEWRMLGCHCWIVQQCCCGMGPALLDKPAVAPACEEPSPLLSPAGRVGGCRFIMRPIERSPCFPRC